MYISSYSTYIDSLQPYKKQPAVAATKVESSFKDQLLEKSLSPYTLNKFFPIDYVNRESTLFNKLRMQKESTEGTTQEAATETSKSLDESLHVSSFDLLKKRAESYAQATSTITSSLKNKEPLKANLGDIKFDIQKSKVANIYLSNDAYFNKRAV